MWEYAVFEVESWCKCLEQKFFFFQEVEKMTVKVTYMHYVYRGICCVWPVNFADETVTVLVQN